MTKFKRFASAIVLATAFSAFTPAANAMVYSIPSEDAVATVNAPDDWEPSETDNGVEMTSSDGGVYIDISAVKANDISSVVASTVKLLAGQGLVIDLASQKTSDSEKNGLKMHDFMFAAKDEDGPTNFALTLVETAVADKYVMLTFWGNDEAITANSKMLHEITGSVQLTKR